MRERIWKLAYKWGTVMLIGVIVVAAFLAPLAVIRDSRNETERIIREIAADSERDRQAALDTAIRINVLTIGCLLLIEPEQRTNEDLDRCIREGLDEVETQP